MLVTVQLNTNDDRDRATLARIFDLPSPHGVITQTAEAVEVPGPKTEKPAPAAKAPAKPKAEPTPPPAAPDEPEAEEPDAFAVLRQAAIDRATELVSEGKSKEVRATLTDQFGVARVSALANDQLQAFLDAVADSVV